MIFIKDQIRKHMNPVHADIRLTHKYNVRRSSGTIENDWKLRDAHIASRYNIILSPRQKVMVLYKTMTNGYEMTKAVPFEVFKQMNPTYT